MLGISRNRFVALFANLLRAGLPTSDMRSLCCRTIGTGHSWQKRSEPFASFGKGMQVQPPFAFRQFAGDGGGGQGLGHMPTNEPERGHTFKQGTLEGICLAHTRYASLIDSCEQGAAVR